MLGPPWPAGETNFTTVFLIRCPIIPLNLVKISWGNFKDDLCRAHHSEHANISHAWHMQEHIIVTVKLPDRGGYCRRHAMTCSQMGSAVLFHGWLVEHCCVEFWATTVWSMKSQCVVCGCSRLTENGTCFSRERSWRFAYIRNSSWNKWTC